MKQRIFVIEVDGLPLAAFTSKKVAEARGRDVLEQSFDIHEIVLNSDKLLKAFAEAEIVEEELMDRDIPDPAPYQSMEDDEVEFEDI